MKEVSKINILNEKYTDGLFPKFLSNWQKKKLKKVLESMLKPFDPTLFNLDDDPENKHNLDSRKT